MGAGHSALAPGNHAESSFPHRGLPRKMYLVFFGLLHLPLSSFMFRQQREGGARMKESASRPRWLHRKTAAPLGCVATPTTVL